MRLPAHTPRAPFDTEGHVVRLIVAARHDLPEMLRDTLSDVWMYGRKAALAVLAQLATPIALYYTGLGEQPPSEYWFAPGTAERFAYGYVSAVAADDRYECERLAQTFCEAYETEIQKAMILMAASAAQSMDMLDQIAAVEAAISPV